MTQIPGIDSIIKDVLGSVAEESKTASVNAAPATDPSELGAALRKLAATLPQDNQVTYDDVQEFLGVLHG